MPCNVMRESYSWVLPTGNWNFPWAAKELKSFHDLMYCVIKPDSFARRLDAEESSNLG
jgi:hypothetical protein